MSLDSILGAGSPSDEGGSKPGKKALLKALPGTIYRSFKTLYQDVIKVKLQLLYELTAAATDRVISFIGLNTQGGIEANPLEAIPAKYIGIGPTYAASFIGVNLLVYGLSRTLVRNKTLNQKQFLGGVYLGLGTMETMVSVHDYMSVTNNQAYGIAAMTFPEAIAISIPVVLAPLAYSMIKNRLSSRNEKKEPGEGY